MARARDLGVVIGGGTPEPYLDPLFYGTIEATEEAIVNALLGAETMTGRDGLTALPPDRLLDALSRR